MHSTTDEHQRQNGPLARYAASWRFWMGQSRNIKEMDFSSWCRCIAPISIETLDQLYIPLLHPIPGFSKVFTLFGIENWLRSGSQSSPTLVTALWHSPIHHYQDIASPSWLRRPSPNHSPPSSSHCSTSQGFSSPKITQTQAYNLPDQVIDDVAEDSPNKRKSKS